MQIRGCECFSIVYHLLFNNGMLMLLYSKPSIIQSLTVLLKEIKEVPRVPYTSIPILVYIILLKYQIIIILIHKGEILLVLLFNQ